MSADENARGDAPSPRARLGLGAAVVMVLLALTVTVGIGVVRGALAPVESVPTDSGGGSVAVENDRPADAGGSASVFVHVSGAVAAPGLYVLDGGSRVVDAIAAAGGFNAEADESAVNLARPLSDGEQVVVAVVGAAPPSTAPGSTGGGDGRVNLNTADAAELDTLPRIGPAMAERIIRWRESNGRFTSVEDLLAVPGIGEKMLESLRDAVTV